MAPDQVPMHDPVTAPAAVPLAIRSHGEVLRYQKFGLRNVTWSTMLIYLAGGEIPRPPIHCLISCGAPRHDNNPRDRGSELVPIYFECHCRLGQSLTKKLSRGASKALANTPTATEQH